jgi:hypothetical protein
MGNHLLSSMVRKSRVSSEHGHKSGERGSLTNCRVQRVSSAREIKPTSKGYLRSSRAKRGSCPDSEIKLASGGNSPAVNGEGWGR